MNKQELRQIIREEIEKIEKNPVIVKDIHLHIHSDGLDAFDFLEKLALLQNITLERQVLERLRE